ncbi:PTS transporter subunit EIIC [Limosilactobacillus secaliphilus]|nr:PTS transporter subunit EIIC [Limosilactobacillus secaliphilus]
MENTSIMPTIVKLMGGKNNIKLVANCSTRLRIQVASPKSVDVDTLNQLKDVKLAKVADHELQLLLNGDVNKNYQTLIKTIGFNEDGRKKRQGPIDFITRFIGDVIMPVLGVITVCGIMKGLLILALQTHLMNPKGGLYLSLYAVSDAVFYFLPLFLGCTTAKRLGIPQFYGGLVGAALVYPTITGKALHFWGIVSRSRYVSSFLPVILIVALMAPIFKWVQAKSPKVVRNFLPGLVSLAIAMPIGLVAVGPASNALADGFSWCIQWFYNFNPIIAGAVIGAAWMYITLYGLFGIVISVVVINIFNGSGDLTLAVSIFNVLVVAGASLAIAFRTKDSSLRDDAYPACVTAIFGVIQPALYGLLLPRKRLFRMTALASAVVGALAGWWGIRKYAMGSGIFGLPTMLNQTHTAFLPILVNALISFVLGFVVIFMMYRHDDDVVGQATPDQGKKKQSK